jgi:hypothetical protein
VYTPQVSETYKNITIARYSYSRYSSERPQTHFLDGAASGTKDMIECVLKYTLTYARKYGVKLDNTGMSCTEIIRNNS